MICAGKTWFGVVLGYMDGWHGACVVQNVAVSHKMKLKIYDMIKGNKSDVGNIDFELQAKIGHNACVLDK